MSDSESLQELYNISGSIVSIYGPNGGECDDEIGQWFHGVYDAMHVFIWESFFSGDPEHSNQVLGDWSLNELKEDAQMRHTPAYSEGYTQCAYAIRKRWDSHSEVIDILKPNTLESAYTW